MISPATAVTDTNTEIPKPRGKFVSVHAWTKLSKVRGLGSEKALPSTAWPVVLKAMLMVTYSGTSTLSVQTIRMMVAGQLLRFLPARIGCFFPAAVGPAVMVLGALLMLRPLLCHE